MKRGTPLVDYAISKDEFYEELIGALNKASFKTVNVNSERYFYLDMLVIKDPHPHDENAIYGIFTGEKMVSQIDAIGFCSKEKSATMRVEVGSSLDKFLEAYCYPSMDDNGAM